MAVSSAPRAPYGRRGREADRPIPSYYGRPALKPPHYGWLIATYFFVGGIAGGSQIVAAAADLVGGRSARPTVRAGRYLALLGALLSPALLVADLHRKDRWYNMLRIYRSTSPMSIGSWTLAFFGAFSGLAALGQLAEDVGMGGPGRALGRFFGLPAAAAGVMMTIYTGALLSATSVPLWLVPYRWLPAVFGSSAMATAAAAVSLWLEAAGAPTPAKKRLERVGLAASATELALTLLIDRRWREAGVGKPVESGTLGLAYRGGVLGLGIGLPLAAHALQLVTGRHYKTLSTVSALAVLAGGLTQRAVLVFGGRESGKRPDDYFGITQPGEDRGWAPS